MKLLIIQNKFIGDVITSSILAENLKIIFPDATIHFFCYQPAVGVLENNPYIDKIISYDPKEIKKLGILLAYALEIRKEQYDIIIDPYAKLESIILTLFSGANRRISYQKYLTRFIYNHRVEVKELSVTHYGKALEDRLALLKPLIGGAHEFLYRSRIYLSKDEIAHGRKLLIGEGLDVQQPIFMIGIIGSTLTKSLPFHLMQGIIDYLLETTNAQLLFNFIPNQLDEVRPLIERYQNNPRVFKNTPAKNIRDLAKVMANCQANIANEGGSVHVSKALDIPTFYIFSPFHSRHVWATFENHTHFSSVHVGDFFPERVANKSQKQLVLEAEELYALMTTPMLVNKLEHWANENNIKKSKVILTPIEEKKKESTITSLHRKKLTVIIPTKNEAHNIEDCLRSIRDIADEILVVDSYSTDKTIEIAQRFNARIIQREFGYPASQKNWAIPQATHEWILLLDADERANNALRDEIVTILKQSNQTQLAYWIFRNNHFMGKRIRFSGWQNDKVIRLFHRDHNRYEDKMVHEEIIPKGKVGVLKNRLCHNTYTSFDGFVEKLNRYASWQAEDYNDKTGKLTAYHFILKPLFRFFKQYIIQQGFRDGIVGIIICYLAAYATFSRYVKLWMLRENIKK